MKPSKGHRYRDHTSHGFDYYLPIHAGLHSDHADEYVDGTPDEGLVGTNQDDYYRHWQRHLSEPDGSGKRYKKNASTAHQRSGVMSGAGIGKRLFGGKLADNDNRKIKYGGTRGLKSNREAGR